MKTSFKIELQRLVEQPQQHSFLIAASGGLDSTALIHLCHQLKLSFGICHVNFQLRGKDSNSDQKFLEKLAEELEVSIYVLKENAKNYAEQNKLSTQEAAREIRYDWFNKILKQESYDYLLTAHHADDNLETYMINSLRGTGIKGLKGIPSRRGYILRPLLNISREEIFNFAQNQNLKWREDQSNSSDNYLRNVIRHHLIPFFQKRQDNIYERFDNTLRNLARQETLLEDYLHMVFKQVVEETEHTYRFKISPLKQFPNFQLILIELLKDFGFSDVKSVINLLDTQVGKYVTSPSHKLVKERGFLELYLLNEQQVESKHINLSQLPKTVNFNNGQLYFEQTRSFHKPGSDIAFLSKDLLKSDLYLRTYKIGDYFCPLGMSGRRKLSDFLKDEKLTTLEKSKVWVLVHNEDIIWVINHRIDERYKITENTQECLKITFLPNV